MAAVKKVVKLMSLVVVVAVVLIALGVYLFGERLIKVGIETAATRSLGVGVYVGGVDLKPFAGKVAIDSLAVRNPIGYSNKNLLTVDNVAVAANIRSLMGDLAKIQTINISGIDLVVEQNDLSNNLKDVVGDIPSKEQEQKQKGQEPTGEPSKKLQIDKLDITDINVKVQLTIAGQSETFDLNLSDIHMTDLGGEEFDTGALAKQIILLITQQVAEKGKGKLPTEFINGLQTELQEAVKRTLEEVLDLGTEAQKLLEKGIEPGKAAGEEVIKNLKDIFDKKKD